MSKDSSADGLQAGTTASGARFGTSKIWSAILTFEVNILCRVEKLIYVSVPLLAQLWLQSKPKISPTPISGSRLLAGRWVAAQVESFRTSSNPRFAPGTVAFATAQLPAVQLFICTLCWLSGRRFVANEQIKAG